MSTKIASAKQVMGVSPLDGLAVVNGVVVDNKCTPIVQEPKTEDSVKKAAPAKKAAPKKVAKEKPVEKQESPKTETFEQMVQRLAAKEFELQQREAAIAEAENLNKQNKALIEKHVQEIIKERKELMNNQNAQPTVEQNKTVTPAAQVPAQVAVPQQQAAAPAGKESDKIHWGQVAAGFAAGFIGGFGAGYITFGD